MYFITIKLENKRHHVNVKKKKNSNKNNSSHSNKHIGNRKIVNCSVAWYFRNKTDDKCKNYL